MKFFMILLFSSMLSIIGCSSIEKEPDQKIEIKEDKAFSILLKLHNEERQKRGLNLLFMDQGLMKYAQSHANTMFIKNKLIHSNISVLLNEYNGFVGENIAYNQKDEESVFKAWMHSRPHRNNILGSYSKIGFGFSKNENKIYWCVVFAN